MNEIGECETCGYRFEYFLVHSGFSAAAYAYCDTCGLLGIFSRYFEPLPNDLTGNDLLPGPIPVALESEVKPCECGGKFRADSSPRCPSCNNKLSALDATQYIEGNAPAASKGYSWQCNWRGLYALLIEDKAVDNPWLPKTKDKNTQANDE